MVSQGSSQDNARERALDRCNETIAWYERQKARHRRAYQFFQFATIILTGITPVLIIAPDLPEIWQAIPPALATVAAGLIGIFQWKENYVRFAYTAEALKSERFKYETRTTKEYAKALDDYRALENFVMRIEALNLNETLEWRSQILETESAA